MTDETPTLQSPASARTLADSTVLVVEDRAMIAYYLQDILHEAGCRRVLLAPTNSAAQWMFWREAPHVAILDIDLAGENSFPTADMLATAKVPFFFLTATSAEFIPLAHRHRKVVGKPFVNQAVVDATRKALLPDPVQPPGTPNAST